MAKVSRFFEKIFSFQIFYLSIWSIIYCALGIFTIVIFKPGRGFQPVLALFLAMNIPITQRFVDTFLALLLKTNDLPKCNFLLHKPRVALLYCTCDDAVIECLQASTRQTYPNYEVFVLDDSQDEHNIRMMDDTGYLILRRKTREGFKAGNLNHWLQTVGKDFDYFVILDADSWLPEIFVEQALFYAEHPSNQNISIFESKILPMSCDSKMSKVFYFYDRISLYITERLHNRLGITLSAGHNNLCRTNTLLELGGFDEMYISEDHATTLNLLAEGKLCRQIDIQTYEGFPGDLETYIQRTARWARSDVQLLTHDWNNTSLAMQFHLFIKSVSHFLRIFCFLGMVYVTLFFRSSLNDFQSIINFLLLDRGLFHPDVLPTIILFSIYLLHLLFAYMPIAYRIGFPLREYLGVSILGMCLGSATLIPTIIAISKSLLNQPFQFTTTSKQKKPVNLSRFFRTIWPLSILSVMMIFGVLRNPVLMVFNWTWIIPLIIAPFVLYTMISSTDKVKEK